MSIKSSIKLFCWSRQHHNESSYGNTETRLSVWSFPLVCLAPTHSPPHLFLSLSYPFLSRSLHILLSLPHLLSTSVYQCHSCHSSCFPLCCCVAAPHEHFSQLIAILHCKFKRYEVCPLSLNE